MDISLFTSSPFLILSSRPKNKKQTNSDKGMLHAIAENK